MKADFWHDKWNNNEIGFDQDQPNPLLVEHWQALNLEANARVFVPLCGKSIDMVWLLHQGHQGVGGYLGIRKLTFLAKPRMEP
mgnify:CR=1 FL=1